MSDDRVATVTPDGHTLLRRRPKWRITLKQGVTVIADSESGAPIRFRFTGEKAAVQAHAQRLLERYFPPDRGRPPGEFVVHPHGWNPTVGPKGGAGNSGAARR